MSKENPFIAVIRKRFLFYKDLGEKAVDQLDERQIHFRENESENSIYIIIRHLHGNMLSRFTDFMESDGEKQWRNRDTEFQEDEKVDKEGLFRLWNEGWDCLLTALHSLKDADLEQQVRIRGEEHLVLDALLRQVAHYAYHVGQIVYLAKQLKGKDWQYLSIPPGNSEQFNQQMKNKYGSA